MPRMIIRDEKLLFGPCADSDLAVIGQEPLFENHGVCARADHTGVQVFVTLPVNQAPAVQKWYLRNHQLISQRSN
jgi:hypothetical protein